MLLWLLLRLPAAIIARALERLGITHMAEPPAAAPPDIDEPPFADPRADDTLPGEDSPNGPPPPSAAEALARTAEREEAAPVPEPEPLREAAPRHVDREAVVVESSGPADDPHAAFQVDEPWDGYATLPAAAIVARLSDADEATRAVVRLYEATHKNRQTVLRATG